MYVLYSTAHLNCSKAALELALTLSPLPLLLCLLAPLSRPLPQVVLPTPLPPTGVPERFSIAWFNQPSPSASLRTCVPVSSISPGACSPPLTPLLFSWVMRQQLTSLDVTRAEDRERMARKGVEPGKDVTADAHLEARLKSTYKLAK